MRVRSLLTISMLIVAVICAHLTPVAAQDSTPIPALPQEERPFAFHPLATGLGSYFQIEIAAGATAPQTALLGNFAGAAQDFRIYPVNAFTAEGSGFAAGERGEALTEPALWMDIREETHTIQSMQGIERTFSISVPDGTAPGQYLTAVAAEHAEKSAVSGSVVFEQVVRVVIPILITVPGEMTTSFTAGEPFLMEGNQAWLLKVPLSNDGDVLVRPTGLVDLFDANGTIIATIPIEMASIYARDETTLTVILQFSGYENVAGAQVTLSDPASGVNVEVSSENLGAPVASDSGVDETPVQITSMQVEPAPAADNVQFAEIEVTISNTGEVLQNGQLTVIAVHNGVEVDRYAVGQALTVNSGETSFSARYVPVTGWTSGTWTFELMLQTVQPSGAAIVLDTALAETGIIIP